MTKSEGINYAEVTIYKSEVYWWVMRIKENEN